ncbi:MAG: MoxR family ATPase [Bacteroidota bacterium]
MEPSSAGKLNLGAVQLAASWLREAIGRVIVGQRELIDLMIAALFADGHVLIEGVPGVAKTLTARLMSRAISAEFSRIQFTPDLMPADVIGTSVFNQQKSIFEFAVGPIFANVVLIDEVNRAPAKTQAALFEVMEERQVTVDGATYAMKPPFFALATQNPIEHEGTYRLPEAQLDRFLFKLIAGYPTLDEETSLLDAAHKRQARIDPDALQPVLAGADIPKLQAAVRSVHIEPSVLRYIAEIVHATRDHPALYVGGSPRASLALLRGAQALAAMDGRDYAAPEDVRRVTEPVLRHRLLLTPDRELDGTTTEDVIRQVVASVEVPR